MQGNDFFFKPGCSLSLIGNLRFLFVFFFVEGIAKNPPHPWQDDINEEIRKILMTVLSIYTPL